MPRLQFSIRALLIVTAIVGGAIAVFRWPWTETKRGEHETVVTPYRRSWNGKAVKHGVELTTEKNLSTIKKWYVEGELRRERHESTGGFVLDESFRDGQLDGPYFERNSTVTQQCLYRQGKPAGIWQEQYSDLVLTTEWHDGELHGSRSWRSPRGELLQVAGYERGRLVSWNGRPVAEALRRWAETNVGDPDVQAKLLATIVRLDEDFNHHYGEKIFYVGDAAEPVSVQWDHPQTETQVTLIGRPLGEAILEEALIHSHTLAYRYHLLHSVPITPQELHWRDQTGLNRIRFPEGSAAEEYWLGPVPNHVWSPGHAADQIKELFSFREQSPIEVDTSDVEHLSPIAIFPHDPNWFPVIPRTRRDLVGQHLNEAGFWCELKAGKLIIRPILVEEKPKTKRQGAD